MKKLYLIFFLLIYSVAVSAQHKKTDTLYTALNKANTDTLRFKALLALSKHYYLGNPDSSIILGQRAYDIARQHNWTDAQARSLNSLANGYATMGDYLKGMQYYLKATRTYEITNNLRGIAAENNNIGATYIQEGDYNGALPYLRLAEKQMKEYALTHKLEVIDKQLNEIILENIGEDYLNLKKIDSAAYYLNICYPEVMKDHFYDIISAIQRDLGEVQAARGDKAGALKYFRQSYPSAIANDDVENLSMGYLSTAKLYYKYGSLDSAEYYAKKALETAAAGKYEQDVLNAGQVLYKYYDEGHDLPEAYKYYKLTTIAKDSLYSQDRVKQLLSLNFDEKQRQEEITAAKIQYQDTVRMYIFIAGLVILLLLVIIFWRNSKRRQKANHLLQKQKEDIQSALSQLRLTQTQLIQSEKMASLGELTAGIAHEIQNPLNFVNNFSEVNTELIAEMQQEIEKGNYEEVKAIATDIKDNQQKISQHGKRADFIVKGMLQHSRTSTGERQLTNINILADEFLKLAYHGLRAKDKNFNAELITNFDTSLPPIKLVQQDIGRVLLNLFNNAFYAVKQKQKTADGDYKPEIMVSTSIEKDQLLIKVKDNGNGIPDAIKEKIMQPFFTTKPTGEGTGLGLSLSYDIVIKGHGGSIEINTKEGEFTEFVVVVPLN